MESGENVKMKIEVGFMKLFQKIVFSAKITY